MSKKEIKGQFTYERDFKRYHRFKINTKAGIIRAIYVPKESETLPDRLILERVK